MTPWRLATAACAAAGVMLLASCGSAVSGAQPPAQLTELNVAVVPAVDSAGFFIALYDGLFRAQGLRVHFIPAISSETVINAQALDEPQNRVDISCGAYPSYIAAQQAWDAGQRPSPADPRTVAADLDVFAEGSVMTPGAQGLYVMADSPIRTLGELRGKTIGINAPGNILYLLDVSALNAAGIAPSQVRFAYFPFPAMAAALASGKIAAATLPEPFASEAALKYGVVSVSDLDEGAATSFPIQGCAVTKEWAALHPVALAAFRAAYEQGQETADQDRSAVEKVMQELPAPLAISREVAALMAIPSFPFGPVDAVRIQRVADVMREFLGGPEFNVQPMLAGNA